MSAVAQQNEIVQFVLQGGPNNGQVRDARVIEAWGGDDMQAHAATIAAHPRYEGRTPADVIEEFGMRATVYVVLNEDDECPTDIAGRMTVANAEHDPSGTRPGCWFRAADVAGYVPPAAPETFTQNDGGVA